MGYVEADPGEEVRMPSNDAYWVRVRTKTYQGHRRTAMEGSYRIAAAFGKDKGTEIANAERDLALAMILDWNLTGPDEQKLPITPETIDECVKGRDLDAVIAVASKHLQEAEEEIAAPLGKPSTPRPRVAK